MRKTLGALALVAAVLFVLVATLVRDRTRETLITTIDLPTYATTNEASASTLVPNYEVNVAHEPETVDEDVILPYRAYFDGTQRDSPGAELVYTIAPTFNDLAKAHHQGVFLGCTVAASQIGTTEIDCEEIVRQSLRVHSLMTYARSWDQDWPGIYESVFQGQ